MQDPANGRVHIIIGMGTSGIASGARETLAAFVSALSDRGLSDVTIRQTGSLGLDFAEPTVEIVMPQMPTVIYGRVNAEVAREIVQRHIIGKELLEGHIYDRPAIDIVGAPKRPGS